MAKAHSGFHENMEHLNTQLKAHPENAELFYKRGENYRNHMKWELAEQDYAQALSLSNAFHRVSFSRARMAFTRGQFESADQHLERFLNKEPGQWEGLLLRAQSHVAQKRHVLAVKDFEKAIVACPRTIPSHYLELARARAAMGQIDLALSGLAEARETIGPVPTLYLEGLDLAKKAGKTKTALGLLTELEQKFGTNPSWLVERGKLHVDAKEPEKAKEAFEAAVGKIQALPARRRNVLAQKLLLTEANEFLKDLESK